ncbi:hypothetical protein [Halobacillus sp. A5]|uniref:hypothetical protein n=1 Tax=Halobacillus sp. A5 TaxID=2880263 RepID=UPI0020A630E3|nr:hypothetical protein [Halobacillus sp. A5]MCP3027166.1 hypothetical protein [Halobacillus sp. A5]
MRKKLIILFLLVFALGALIDYIRFDSVSWGVNLIQAFFFTLVYSLMLRLFGGRRQHRK